MDGIVKTLLDTRVRILEATGSTEGWNFRLRFSTHEDLSAFNMALTDGDIPITLRHIYNPTPPDEQTTLSADQRDTLLMAYHRGYFEVPRRKTLAELAVTMDISDSVLSQRLRRATDALIEQTLVADARPQR